jgi:imidazolonepropionase-like amidohydrolase
MTEKRVTLLLLTISTCFVIFAHAADAASATVALVADRLIDGRVARAREGVAVAIEGDRITAVGDRGVVPAGAEVIDLAEMTPMPGVINAHEHPLMYADDYQNAHLRSSSAYEALMGLTGVQRHLLAGWTAIRVAGDADVFYAAQDLRRVIDAGIFLGPRLSGAGHYI